MIFHIVWKIRQINLTATYCIQKQIMIINKQSNLLIAVSLVLILGLFYFSYNPANTQFFPKCPVNYVTGLSCPGCGSQRAIHELLHLNFKEAFAYNPLLVASIPYITLGIAFSTESLKTRYPKTRKFLYGQNAWYVIMAILVLFFIFRNI